MIGLKENVIIGKLIPVGTGMRQYRDVKLDTGKTEEIEEVAEEVTEEVTESVAELVLDENVSEEVNVEA